jgi:hypothetical protein
MTAWYQYKVTQGYTVGHGGVHNGYDFATPVHTPLTALYDGVVTQHTGWYPWGGEVDIKTASGITQVWAHMDAETVHPGDTVRAGQLIGYSGGEGLPHNFSTGPHTHFTLTRGAPWDNAASIDPGPSLQQVAARSQLVGGDIAGLAANWGLSAQDIAGLGGPVPGQTVPGIQGLIDALRLGTIGAGGTTTSKSGGPNILDTTPIANAISGATNFANARVSQVTTRIGWFALGIALLAGGLLIIAWPAIQRARREGTRAAISAAKVAL